MIYGSKIHQRCFGIVVQSLVEMSTKEPYCLAIAEEVQIHRPVTWQLWSPIIVRLRFSQLFPDMKGFWDVKLLLVECL